MFRRNEKDVVMVFVDHKRPGNELGKPVTVISLQSNRTRTRAGLRIGDSVATMKRTYPTLRKRPSYDWVHGRTDVHELVDGQYSLFMESRNGVVKHISVQAADDFSPIGQVGPCGGP